MHLELRKKWKKHRWEDVQEGKESLNFAPQLLSTEDVSGAEEGDAWKSQVLVQHEHTYWDEVWVTQVVDKAADVAVVTGVDTIHLPVLYRKQEEKRASC